MLLPGFQNHHTPEPHPYPYNFEQIQLQDDITPKILTGVTHNYEREGDLNLWFTIITDNAKEIDTFIEDLERRFLLKIYRFPKKRVFKIKTFFPV